MMRDIVKKAFALVPSVQRREGAPAPTAFIAALPVRFESGAGLTAYAAIDTGSQLSMLSQRVAGKLKLERVLTEEVTVHGYAGVQRLAVAHVPLVICDPSFKPWLRLGPVPFVVAKGDFGGPDVSLGFDSCLSRLRLTLDYPGRTLEVSADKSLETGLGSGPEIPARVEEGEELIGRGSYTSGVILVAAGLEELLRLSVGSDEPKNVMQLMTIAGLDEASTGAFQRLWNIRNSAVHGTREISEREAYDVLHLAQLVITDLWKPNTKESTRRTNLTNRELQVLQRMTDGDLPSEIAAKLGLRRESITRHVRAVLAKTGSRSTTEAVVKALSSGLVRAQEAS